MKRGGGVEPRPEPGTAGALRRSRLADDVQTAPIAEQPDLSLHAAGVEGFVSTCTMQSWIPPTLARGAAQHPLATAAMLSEHRDPTSRHHAVPLPSVAASAHFRSLMREMNVLNERKPWSPRL